MDSKALLIFSVLLLLFSVVNIDIYNNLFEYVYGPHHLKSDDFLVHVYKDTHASIMDKLNGHTFTEWVELLLIDASALFTRKEFINNSFSLFRDFWWGLVAVCEYTMIYIPLYYISVFTPYVFPLFGIYGLFVYINKKSQKSATKVTIDNSGKKEN